MNRDHSVVFEIAPKYCILDCKLRNQFREVTNISVEFFMFLFSKRLSKHLYSFCKLQETLFG